MCLPPSGWLSNELLAGRIFSTVVWLERGACTSTPNQECPPRFNHRAKEGIAMTMIGIDPHKATHTAVAVDDNERGAR